MNIYGRVLISVAAVGLCAGMAMAQDANEPADAFEAFHVAASEYRIQKQISESTLTMQPQSLLNWNNPARNGESGSVFLWTDDRRPCVVGTCFNYTWKDEKRRKHALHVLTDEPLQATHRDRAIWTPRAKGVAFKRLPNSPPPGANTAQRNRQLRLLARKFEVTLTKKDQRQEQCRLVPQPLYRFESKDGKHAGAIFSFAVGTDPEALLLLETRSENDGEPAWYYGFARFTFYPLEAKVGEESVWQVEESESLSSSIFSRPDYQTEPYITFRAEWLD